MHNVWLSNDALFTVSRVTIKSFANIKQQTEATELDYYIILNHIFEYIHVYEGKTSYSPIASKW